MGRGSLLLVLTALNCGPSVVHTQPNYEALASQLHSSRVDARLQALEMLGTPAEAPANVTSAVLDMMGRVGWSGIEIPSACRFLAAAPQRAPMSFTLLTEWMIASEGDQTVFLCLERAARAAGIDGITTALRVTASVAQRTLPGVNGDPDAMFDTMATARRAYTRPLIEFGRSALPALNVGLANADPFIRAEAAAFLNLMGGEARLSEALLRRTLDAEASQWAAHEIRAALANLRK